MAVTFAPDSVAAIPARMAVVDGFPIAQLVHLPQNLEIGGNLKKNSPGLVEVDRVEVFTVPYLGYMNAEIQ